jgi:hypothetical protein
MHVSDRMFLERTDGISLLFDMLREFFWLPLVEFVNEFTFIATALLQELTEALVHFFIKAVIGFLDATFPEPKYNRIRYDEEGKPKTGSRALRFLKQEYKRVQRFFHIFPKQWNNPQDAYYWKYAVGYLWHQTIKRETFGRRLNPKRNMMVLVEITAAIFAVWAVVWHFHSLVALVWFDAPWWFNVLTVITLIIADIVTIEFVRFLSWIEFFKYDIDAFYTSPWYMDGGKLHGRTLIENLVWRAMNVVVFLTIAAYCPKAIDPRVYDIVMRAVWWLMPLILGSTVIYFALPVIHFLDGADEQNKTAVTWVITILVLITVLAIGGVVLRTFHMGFPDFHISLPHIEWPFVWCNTCAAAPLKDTLIALAKAIGIVVGSGLILAGIAWFVYKQGHNLNDYRVSLEGSYEREWTLKELWWIPSITVLLFWVYFIPSYYNEVYLPDRLAAMANVPAQTTPVPTQQPVASVTPLFTTTPFETLTATPTVMDTATFSPTNTATLTVTPEPALPTATWTPVPSFTATNTEAPTLNAQTPQAAVTQDMALPAPVATDALVQNCSGVYQSASYQLSIDPDKAYCIQGLTAYNAGGARYKVNGKDYIIIFVVVDNTARYYLSGDIPTTAVCTVNGQRFEGGASNYVSITAQNSNSRLSCDFDDINITAIGWNIK